MGGSTHPNGSQQWGGTEGVRVGTSAELGFRDGGRPTSPPASKNASVCELDCIHFLHKFRKGGGGEGLPPKYLDSISSWRRANPSCCVVVHEPEDIAGLLRASNSSGWLSLFRSYEHFIQKCDVSRYVLMYLQGGVYTDVDIQVKRGLGESTRLKYPKAKVFLGTERVLPAVYAEAMAAHEIRNGTAEHPTRVANYFMMSEPRHEFWSHVMAIAKKRAGLPVAESYDILYTTGPDVLTEAYHTYEDKEGEIVLLDVKEFAALLRHGSDGHWRANFSTSDLLVYARAGLIVLRRYSLPILLLLWIIVYRG